MNCARRFLTTWAVKAPHVSRDGFYLYGNDHARGFDVYRWRPSAGAAASPGRWLTPGASAVAAQRLRTAGTGARLARLCLIDPGKPAEVSAAAARAGLDV
jgi:hypothetical protein